MRTLATLLVTLAVTVPAALEAAPVTVPLNVGIGPAGQLVTGPVFRDQPVHFGLKLRLEAVIDNETIRKYQNRIPKKYRQMALQMDEFRYRPSIFVPETLFISPAFWGTGMYGATWKVISVGVPARGGPFYFRLAAGLIVTMAGIHSRTLVDGDGDRVPFIFFLRPGIDFSAELEIKLHPRFLISLGWSSAVHLPQVVTDRVGESFLSIPGDGEALRQSIWHFGSPYLIFHYRFPVTRNFGGPAGGGSKKAPAKKTPAKPQPAPTAPKPKPKPRPSSAPPPL